MSVHSTGGSSVPLRIAVSYGLRRSELLALKWNDIDFDAGTLRVDEALVEVWGVATWTNCKNERSRRTISLDQGTLHELAKHHSSQNEEQILVGEEWQNNDLLVATQLGHVVNPGNFKQTLERLVVKAGVRRLTSHGLRHTAATHMVRAATDVGELRAIADVLGHSPDMLMKTYAHALPESVKAVADKIGERSGLPS